jgi:hypothetical protein
LLNSAAQFAVFSDRPLEVSASRRGDAFDAFDDDELLDVLVNYHRSPLGAWTATLTPEGVEPVTVQATSGHDALHQAMDLIEALSRYADVPISTVYALDGDGSSTVNTNGRSESRRPGLGRATRHRVPGRVCHRRTHLTRHTNDPDPYPTPSRPWNRRHRRDRRPPDRGLPETKITNGGEDHQQRPARSTYTTG